MDVNKVNTLAKMCMTTNDHSSFMNYINTQQLNTARIKVEEQLDKLSGQHHVGLKQIACKKLDTIITNEYIKTIDARISK
jgi:hypothetical protein